MRYTSARSAPKGPRVEGAIVLVNAGLGTERHPFEVVALVAASSGSRGGPGGFAW